MTWAALVGLAAIACGMRDEDGVRKEPSRLVVEPDPTPRRETPPRRRATAHAGARADATAARHREPLVGSFAVPRLGPAAPAQTSTSSSMSAPSGAYLAPVAPGATAPIQGLPAAPQRYGGTSSNFGPIGPIPSMGAGGMPPGSGSSSSFVPGR